MNKADLITLIKLRLSTYQIAKKMGKSQTTTRHWLKKFGLKTNSLRFRKSQDTINDKGITCRTCPQCKLQRELNKENHYINSKGRAYGWCKGCSNKMSCERQRTRKQQCVALKGGKCIFCGYNKYVGSLEFHHVDPSKKQYNISKLRSYSITEIKKELDKCILLCRNCHGELHAGIITIKMVSSAELEIITN